jgi:hypothetical protein
VWDISSLIIVYTALSEFKEVVFNSLNPRFQSISRHLHTFEPDTSLSSVINFINFYPNCNHLLVLLKDGRLFLFNVRTHHRIDLLYKIPQMYIVNQSWLFDSSSSSTSEFLLPTVPGPCEAARAPIPFTPEVATLLTYTVPSMPYTPSSSVIMHFYRDFYRVLSINFNYVSHPSYLPFFYTGFESSFGKKIMNPCILDDEKQNENSDDEFVSFFRVALIFLFDKRFNFMIFRAHTNDLMPREVCHFFL